MKVRMFVASFLAIFIMGAISAGTAAAEEPCKQGAAGEWCFAVELGGELLLFAEAKFTSFKEPGTTSELKDEGLPNVSCKEANDEGVILNGARPQVDKLVINFKGECKYTTGEACKFKEPVTTTPLSGEVTLSGGVPEILFKPESGTLFAYLQTEGTCENAAKVVVGGGTQLCEAADLEEDLLMHLLHCPFEGSELKNGTKKVEFLLDEFVVLLNFEEDKWGAFESLT